MSTIPKRSTATSIRPLTERRLLRAALGAALIMLSGLVLTVADTRSAGAACGTNWSSKVEPPDSILVLHTATDKVEEVGLKKYVAVVMASGEWPTSLPVALLEAGALATKQYGWYYALEGNHRDGHENGAGHCYDVRGDSNDQVYRPETAEPTDKQKAARDALWGLSLRKNDEFFLTGIARAQPRRARTMPTNGISSRRALRTARIRSAMTASRSCTRTTARS